MRNLYFGLIGFGLIGIGLIVLPSVVLAAPPTLEGVWRSSGLRMQEPSTNTAVGGTTHTTKENETSMAFCGDTATLFVQLSPELVVPMQYRYEVIAGNANVATLELTEESGVAIPMSIEFVGDKIVVQSQDCRSNPEPCRRSAIRFIEALALKVPSLDTEPILASISAMDYSQQTGVTAVEYERADQTCDEISTN